MNTLKGIVSNLKTTGHMTLVELKVGKYLLKSIVLETPQSAPYLKIDNTINVLFKETEVIIAKGDLTPMSLQNRINGVVSKIERGEILGRLTLDSDIGEIVSLITTSAIDQLILKKGDNVTAMVKTNEIMLSA
ncbi:MAG: TOBE domain-containing protein [Cyclobacteriaceae bacterium]|nr:TOBE domain-containing protein [Cyclobacteriaceae bacterium]